MQTSQQATLPLRPRLLDQVRDAIRRKHYSLPDVVIFKPIPTLTLPLKEGVAKGARFDSRISLAP
jgi:hypothetical protein